MAYRVLFRRDTSTNWNLNNPTLISGEPGYETDTDKLKIGDGVSDWLSLNYIVGPTGITGFTGATGQGTTGENLFYGNQTIVGGTSGTLILENSPSYPSDNAAATGGIPLYGIYNQNGSLHIRIT